MRVAPVATTVMFCVIVNAVLFSITFCLYRWFCDAIFCGAHTGLIDWMVSIAIAAGSSIFFLRKSIVLIVVFVYNVIANIFLGFALAALVFHRFL